MYIINHAIGTNRKKFFFSGMGGGYNDNARAVSEALHEKMPDAKIYWLISEEKGKDSHIPSYIQVIEGRLNRIYQMATSKVWVFCGTHSRYVYKGKKQKYVQLWHGDRGLKKILKDSIADPDSLHLYETSNCDLMTSGSAYYNKVLKSAFGYNGEILEAGCPRNDMLLKEDAELRERILKSLHIPNDKKIMLFAPTFRDVSVAMDAQREDIDIDSLLGTLSKRYGGEWLCLGRFHPITRHQSHFISDRIIDVTDYYDMADLLYISDVLITDYSSSAGDFVLMKKPVYLYQPDLEKYMSNDRDLYMKPEEIPFLKASTQAELEDIILNTDDDAILENCRVVDDFYGTTETGHASEAVVDYMLK